MNKYELMVILKSDIPDAGIEKAISDIKEVVKKHGEMIEAKEWAKKKSLAYPINKVSTGTYWLITLTAATSVASALNQKLKMMPDVMRHLLIVKE